MSIVQPKLHVFLCHASQDKPAVREIYNALKTQNWIEPWLDKVKILPGQGWRTEIEKAVEESDVVIICLSNQSVAKEGFVQKEIRYAYDIALEKPEETIFLIPLRLEECNTPRGLRTIQWVDYFGPEKKDHYAYLLESLRTRYEQLLPKKLEELEIRQREEKRRQEYENHLRKEREKARRSIEEHEQKEALERAKHEAEMLARQEVERKKNYSPNYDRIDDSFDDISPYPRKNNSPTIVAVFTIVFCCFCIFATFVWYYGDAILQSIYGG